MAHRVKPRLPVRLAFQTRGLAGVLAAALLMQLPADVSGKVAKDDPSATRWETRMEVLTIVIDWGVNHPVEDLSFKKFQLFKKRGIVPTPYYHFKRVGFFPSASWYYVDIVIVMSHVGKELTYRMLWDHSLPQCSTVMIHIEVYFVCL